MVFVSASAIHHTEKYGDFNIYIFKEEDNSQEHIVLTRGDLKGHNNVLCRVSSECLPSTTLFSAECDCQEQIQFALEKISKANEGIFIYLRQEGRGYGLTVKIRSLANKNKGFDTFTATEELGLPADSREYTIVKAIIDYFEIKSIICMSNNPEKVNQIKDVGVKVKTIMNIPVSANSFSLRHLKAKQERGHKIDFTVDEN